MGQTLLTLIENAEANGNQHLVTVAIASARAALMEIPDAFREPDIVKAASWRTPFGISDVPLEQLFVPSTGGTDRKGRSFDTSQVAFAEFPLMGDD
ncbi:hypothetical protein ACRDNQ_05905 [Palleronia sp. KMU-117]|uniref:hypothetical protein n=1 Tax=Palleronia sp. KMU-117 TaxID=3434108 RepID=UPI003D73C158